MTRFYALLLLLGIPVVIFGQIYTIPAVTDPAFEQLPIIYVHGFNDDGRYWAIHSETGLPDFTPAHYWQNLGINTYVAQWWATQGFPYANAELGWARLFSPGEIRGNVTGVTPYNSPHPGPIQYFSDNWLQFFSPLPGARALFLIGLYNNRIENNYNRNGIVEAHAQNLVDVLHTTDGFGGKLAGHRQVNIITHSAGGLDTRAMLSILNESEDQRERERVANVIYTAPPFGGSNMAEIARIIWQPQTLDGGMFSDPWFQSAIGDKSIAEFLSYALKTYVPEQHHDVVDKLLQIKVVIYISVATLQGIIAPPSLYEIKVGDLIANPILANIVASAIQDWRNIASYVVGFPGDPKVWEDLIPEKAVEHLNRWESNLHTKQFVTWGEGGPQINATPPLETARGDFSTLTNPNGLQRYNDDMAVSHVSARVLTGDQGYMSELGGYANLDHGGVLLNIGVVANDWARTLLTPVTDLIVSGSVIHANEESRYFIVGPSAQFQFNSESRSFTDLFLQGFTVSADAIEYRIAARNPDQTMEYHEWVTVPNLYTATFETLLQPYDLGGERLFRMDWRAVNQQGGREAVRSAFFAIDDLPPSLTNVDMIHVGVENSGEIYGKMNRSMEGLRIVSDNVASILQQNPFLTEIRNKPLTDWIIRNQSNKILFLQFDQSATVRYQWNSPLTNPETRETVNQNLSFVLTDLPDGPNTLYFMARDNANNETNMITVSVLVDNQPPVVALDYQPPGYLDWVAGPTTPLSILAEDLETQIVTGSVSVPGLSELPIGSTFRLEETGIAEQGQQIGAFGMFVPISVTATDAVGNTITETFDVYYDWTPPELDLQYVGRTSLQQGNVFLQTDGTYITTENRLHFEITATTNAAGIQPIVWQSSSEETGQMRSGGPFQAQSFIRGFAHGGNVNLFNGVNTIVFSTTDDYGQHASFTVIVEKVDQLFADVERPIELIADGNTDQIAVSDDGAVFVFRRDNNIFAWRNGTIEQVDVNETGEPANERGRDPAVSGNGRYVYFASRATNLIDEEVSGKNFYVKDLVSGKIALLSRNKDGNPVNMNAVFARFSFVQNAVTYSGRYVFFSDKYADYLEDATNNGLDIYVIDLDPDVNGDFFDSPYELRRVSVGPGNAEGTGDATATGGSRYPSVSADGLYLTYQTSHTNLFANDTNDQPDVILTRFAGVDDIGTIDFSQISNIPLNVNSNGTINQWGARNPWIDRSGRVVVFHTFGNLVNDDTNRDGVDSDTYSSTAITDIWTTRVLKVESKSHTDNSVQGNMWATPSVSLYEEGVGARSAFISDMTQLVPGDNNDGRDLFVRTESGIEAINWITPEIPAGSDLGITGGLSADGKWAWWNTNHTYAGLPYSGQGGRAIHRRHIDPEPPEAAPQIVQQPSNRSVYIGQSASFSVQASGFPIPTYQWYLNGQEIENANQSVLTIANVSLANRGEYTVTASNSVGSASSQPALLNVTSLMPLITDHPQSQTAEEGTQVKLGVSAIGVAPLQYRWLFNGIAMEESEHFSGVESDTLIILGVVFANAGEYRVRVTNGAGGDTSQVAFLAVTPTTGVRDRGGVPETYTLHQNFPNPFNPTTTIRYDIPEQAMVNISIYNILGQRVRELVDTEHTPGYYRIVWDGTNGYGRAVSSGMYIYRITAGEYSSVKRLLLIK
jgi:hypothetical protein